MRAGKPVLRQQKKPKKPHVKEGENGSVCNLRGFFWFHIISILILNSVQHMDNKINKIVKKLFIKMVHEGEKLTILFTTKDT